MNFADVTLFRSCAAIRRAGTFSGLKTDVVSSEVANQLEYLRRFNCDEVQGYLISRLGSADSVLALLDAKSFE